MYVTSFPVLILASVSVSTVEKSVFGKYMVDTSREQIKKHKGFLAVFCFLKYMIYFLLACSITKTLSQKKSTSRDYLEDVCVNMLT